MTVYLKDLTKISGFDPARTVIVDNVKENFALQPENGLHIKEFTDDQKDKELIKLERILASLSTLDDVRVGIKNIGGQVI
jgi:TFIIF-interacting CTD phosphatase-like protein